MAVDCCFCRIEGNSFHIRILGGNDEDDPSYYIECPGCREPFLLKQQLARHRLNCNAYTALKLEEGGSAKRALRFPITPYLLCCFIACALAEIVIFAFYREWLDDFQKKYPAKVADLYKPPPPPKPKPVISPVPSKGPSSLELYEAKERQDQALFSMISADDAQVSFLFTPALFFARPSLTSPQYLRSKRNELDSARTKYEAKSKQTHMMKQRFVIDVSLYQAFNALQIETEAIRSSIIKLGEAYQEELRKMKFKYGMQPIAIAMESSRGASSAQQPPQQQGAPQGVKRARQEFSVRQVRAFHLVLSDMRSLHLL